MDNSSRFEADVQERIAVITDNGKGSTIELNVVSFNGYPAKLDLRKWYNGQPQKGVQLTAEAAAVLAAVLHKYLKKGD